MLKTYLEFIKESISEIEKQSIDKGIQDADNGKLIDHAKARKLYEKWL